MTFNKAQKLQIETWAKTDFKFPSHSEKLAIEYFTDFVTEFLEIDSTPDPKQYEILMDGKGIGLRGTLEEMTKQLDLRLYQSTQVESYERSKTLILKNKRDKSLVRYRIVEC